MTILQILSIALFGVAFISPLIGVAIGITLRKRLPEHHLSKDATDVIKLAIGVMATLVALVLSLLLSSANTYRASIESEYRQGLATVVQLDDDLGAYGPEASDIRASLRHMVAFGFQQRWPGEDFGPKQPPLSPRGAMIGLEQQIVDLKPVTPGQHWFQTQALQASSHLAALQRLVLSQQAGGVTLLPVFALIFLCTAAIYGSFSLFVQPNATVIGALCLSALAIAGATFLIMELNNPFQGVLQISSRAAHVAWQLLNGTCGATVETPCVP
jgi:hypothetical protein